MDPDGLKSCCVGGRRGCLNFWKASVESGRGRSNSDFRGWKRQKYTTPNSCILVNKKAKGAFDGGGGKNREEERAENGKADVQIGLLKFLSGALNQLFSGFVVGAQ